MKNTFTPGRKATLGFLVTALASGLLLTSCKKEELNVYNNSGLEWNPSIAVPLVDTKVTVEDILDRFDDEEVIVLLNDTLALRYRSEIFSLYAQDLFNIPDQAIATPGTPLSPADLITVNSGGSATFPVAADVPMTAISGASLTSVRLKAGNLDLSATHDIPHNATFNLTIPSLKTPGGASYTATLVLPPSGSDAEPTLNLAGYTLDFTAGGSTNEVTVNASVTYTGSGGVANSTQTFQVALSFSALEFSRIDGDMGTQTVPVPLDSVRIRIFENSTSGTITWFDPRLRAYFSNGFGIPMSMFIDQLSGRSAPTGTVLPITGIGPTVNITASPSPGVDAFDTFVLTKATPGSNIQAVAALRPDFIVYQVTGTTNPAGPATNFVLDTSKVKLDMEVELPFYGTASGFTVADTIKLVASDSTIQANDIEDIQSIMLRLYVNNGFPAEGHVQVYFMDSTNSFRIDSLILDGGQFLAPAVVDASGRVIEKVEKTTDITITRTQLEKLVNLGVRNLVVQSRIDSNDMGATTVIIFKGYYMDVKLGLMVEIKHRF